MKLMVNVDFDSDRAYIVDSDRYDPTVNYNVLVIGRGENRGTYIVDKLAPEFGMFEVLERVGTEGNLFDAEVVEDRSKINSIKRGCKRYEKEIESEVRNDIESDPVLKLYNGEIGLDEIDSLINNDS